MNTPARYSLRLGTLLLSLMVTLLWIGPRAQSSVTREVDASDPTVQLALGVVQGGATVLPAASARPASPLSLDAPAVSDLIIVEQPDEIVPVVAPLKNATKLVCEDV